MKINVIPFITQKMECFLSRSRFFVSLYSMYYKIIVKHEVNLANIKYSDRVLCIGGGSVCSSAILIAKYTGAKVTVIDIDRCAVQNSRKVIRCLNLEDLIDVRLADGRGFDTKGYDVLHIALQVYPKGEVLKNVMRGSSIDSRILVRRPKDMLKGLYGFMFDDCYCKYCGKATYRNFSVDSTILFMKV